MTTTDDAIDFLTPKEVCELVPGLTVASLAQRRYKGLEPRWYAPTPRRPIYRRSDVLAWIEGSMRTITGDAA